jgi:hypothetical protein
MLHAGNDSQFSVTSRSYHINSRRPPSDTVEAPAQPIREADSQSKVQPNLFRRVNAKLQVAPPPTAPKLWRMVGVKVQPSHELPVISLQKVGGVHMKVRKNLFRTIRTETPVEEITKRKARRRRRRLSIVRRERRSSSRARRDPRPLSIARREPKPSSKAKRNPIQIPELSADEQELERAYFLQLSAGERRRVRAYVQRLRSEKTQDKATSSDLLQATAKPRRTREISAQNRALAGAIRMVLSTREEKDPWGRVLTQDTEPSRRAVPSHGRFRGSARRPLVSRVSEWLSEPGSVPQTPVQQQPTRPARVFGSRHMRHDAVVDWNDERGVDALRELEWVEESESEAPRRSASLVVKGGVAGVGVDAGEGGDGVWGIRTVKMDRDEMERINAQKEEEKEAKSSAEKEKAERKAERKAARKAKERARREDREGKGAVRE